MILVDTSIWADHISRPDRTLSNLLEEGDKVMMHPYVVGEVALGNLRDRSVLTTLGELPQAPVAFHSELLSFIERHALQGSGIGYVDAHLLASARLVNGSLLWTRDRRLSAVAERLGIAADPSALS